MKRLVVYLAAMMMILGCAWSPWNRDAGTTFNRKLTKVLEPYRESSKELFIAQFGEPLKTLTQTATDRFGTPIGAEERLLWLWEADGSGPSTQPEQGWEILVRFKNGKYAGWERGAYRTTVTLADVLTAARKVGSEDPIALMHELEFGAGQPGTPSGNENLQKKILAIASAVHRLDAAAKTVRQLEPNQPDKATEADVVKYLLASKLYRVDVQAKHVPKGTSSFFSDQHSLPLSALSPISTGPQELGNHKGASELPLTVPAPNF